MRRGDRRQAWTNRRLRLGAAGALLLLIAGAGAWIGLRARLHPRYEDTFSEGRSGEWKAFGGAWRIEGDALRNDSDERGAKTVTGSSRWRDYRMQAEVKLLGEGGDAGVILRASDEEPGVDAYDGYYVGIRMYDSSLVIGRSDHGWLEGRPLRLEGPALRSHAWYRLDVAVVGCSLAASAGPVDGPPAARALFEEPDCVRAGRIGLRSLATGAAWRRVRVQPAADADLSAVAGASPPLLHPDYPRTEAAFNAAHDFPTFDDAALRRRFFGEPGPRAELVPIARIHVLVRSTGVLPRSAGLLVRSRGVPPQSGAAGSDAGQSAGIALRGTVSATSPVLFVQDESGGIAVPAPQGPALNLGDEVEVSGTPVLSGDLIGASASLPHARVRLLWDHTPPAALSITAAQAASGEYDGRLVELAGMVSGVRPGRDAIRDGASTGERGAAVSQMPYVDLVSGSQAFRAYLPAGLPREFFRRLSTRSLVNLRGVCTLDPHYLQGATSFALLLRSADDVDLLAGPPWWTPLRLAETASLILLLGICAQYLYGRAMQWRWRAIVEERERLAHELHDTLAQSFAGVAFQLQGIRNGLARPDAAGIERANQQLDAACEVVRQTHEEASLSIAMLREEWPAGREIGEALEQCAAGIVAGGQIRIVRLRGEESEGVRTAPANVPGHIPVRVADALFHIGREAVVNAVRHARPGRITLSVEYRPTAITMTVEDDGRGFHAAEETAGFGLRGMKKRARGIGAELSIGSLPGQGTRVRVVAPLGEHRSSRGLWPELCGRVWGRLRAAAAGATEGGGSAG
jgi:signal transduction histidine kinase